MKKYALVLSGGGFKGAFQVGALRYLQRQWKNVSGEDDPMKFDLVAGVSVGALNGFFAAANEFDALETLWREVGANIENIYTSDFLDPSAGGPRFSVNFQNIRQRFLPDFRLRVPLLKLPGLLLSGRQRERYLRSIWDHIERELARTFPSFRSIADNSPLRRQLERYVRRDKIQDCIYKCGFVSLDTGVYHAPRQDAFDNDDDFRNAILASTAMPILWEPVPEIRFKGGPLDAIIRQAVDGGVRNVSPLGDVIEEINREANGDYTIVIINCSPGTVDPEIMNDAHIASIAVRALVEIATTEIFNNDVNEFLRINDILAQIGEAGATIDIKNYNGVSGRTETVLKRFRAVVIQADPGVLGDMLWSDEALTERRIRHGMEKAEDALKRVV